MKNRSVPTDIVLPHVTYQNVALAIEWLSRVFGFKEYYRYGSPDAPDGAQIHLGQAFIQLQTTREGRATPARLGASTQSLTVFVDDVDAHFSRAKSEGAEIVEDLNETIYGERQYVAKDLDGHRWLFSKHVHDVCPDTWGAIIAKN